MSSLLGGASERLAFILSVDANGAIRGFGQVRAAADRELEQVENRIDRVAGGMQAGGAAAIGFSLVAGRALVSLGSQASDLAEVTSKTSAVFGDQADELEAWAATGARAFGQSRRAALEAASGFGNLFVQLGIGTTQAADMSRSLTELASDFASFHNANPADVIEAQTAAFRGEYDALQRFVPTINAAAVQQRAMADTGKANAGALTDQEKALATYALMLDGAGDALGDFDRTSGGAANQQRIFAAELENLQTAIGAGVLPMLTSLISTAADVTGAIGGMSSGTLSTVGAIGAVTTAGIGAVGTLSFMAGSVMKMRDRFRDAEGGLNNFGKAAKLAGVATALAGVAVAIRQIDVEARQLADDFGSTVRRSLEDTDGGFAEFQDNLANVDRGIQDLSDTIAGSQAPWDIDRRHQLRQGRDELEAVRDEYRQLERQVLDLAAAENISTEVAYQRITADRTRRQRVDELATSIGEQAAEEQVAAEEAEVLASAHEEAADAADEFRRSMEDLSDAIADNAERLRGNTDLVAGYEQAVDDLTETLGENGDTLDLQTESGRDNYRAMRDVADAVVELMRRRFEETGSLQAAIDAGNLYVQNLRDQLSQAGLTEDQIDRYIATLGLVPSKIVTTIRADTREAVEAIQALQRLAAGVGEGSNVTSVHDLPGSGPKSARDTPKSVSISVSGWGADEAAKAIAREVTWGIY